MRENSGPRGKLGPTTPGSMKSGFPCYCKNTSTAYQIHMDFGWCIIAKARKPWFHWARCCNLHVVGAEFSRIYGINNLYKKRRKQIYCHYFSPSFYLGSWIWCLRNIPPLGNFNWRCGVEWSYFRFAKFGVKWFDSSALSLNAEVVFAETTEEGRSFHSV